MKNLAPKGGKVLKKCSAKGPYVSRTDKTIHAKRNKRELRAPDPNKRSVRSGRRALTVRLSKRNERIAMPNYWRARINPRVARGKLRVLHDGMGQRRSASPPNPCVLVALCQIEREGLRGDEPPCSSV